MYDFQSRSSDWSFAMIASFFRKSFKRPSAFDSGSTHRITSIQSLSVMFAGEFSCLFSACLAFTNSFARLSTLDFDCDSTFLASKSSCSFWALNTTLAFPILVPHTFHNADASPQQTNLVMLIPRMLVVRMRSPQWVETSLMYYFY